MTNKTQVYEFRTDTIVDAKILMDAFTKIKTKESFMIYNKGRYFKISFVMKDE